MASSTAPTRHSTRTAHAPATLQQEQGHEYLSILEQRDIDAALRLSLGGAWEDDASDDDEEIVERDADESEEEEEKKEEAHHAQQHDEWTSHLTDIDVPLPRSRHLQNRPPPDDHTPLHILQYFLSTQLMDEFAEHTNAAAPYDWRHTTARELYAFLGVHIFMGIVRLPSVDMYWSDAYRQSAIASILSRDRYKQLQRYFRVVSAPVGDSPRNPIPHVRALAEKLNHSFAAHFTPTHRLTLDEAMAATKCRADIKQYLPMKPHKWGYKIYCLASENYLLHFEVYEGKEEDPSASGATYDTVMRMIQPYQNQQLVLYTDSWFTSPVLMSALKEKGVRSCGAVRTNRRGLPQIDAAAVKALQRGECIQRQKGDMSMAVWKDQKAMRLLYNHVSPRSTATLDRWDEHGERVAIGCPQALHDYFYHARSVDVINQLHYSYRTGRRSRRCWPRLAWWLLDMCILNAFRLWSIGQRAPEHLRFRELLMDQLLKQMPMEQMPRREGGVHPAATALAKDHYSVLMNEARDCKHCSHQPDERRRTNYMCSTCNAHLCLGPCFQAYHTRV
jgi:hypothetical protein